MPDHSEMTAEQLYEMVRILEKTPVWPDRLLFGPVSFRNHQRIWKCEGDIISTAIAASIIRDSLVCSLPAKSALHRGRDDWWSVIEDPNEEFWEIRGEGGTPLEALIAAYIDVQKREGADNGA